MSELTIDDVVIAAEPECWSAAGFAVDEDGVCRLGSVRVRLAGAEAGRGILGWSLRGVADPSAVDGLVSTASNGPPAEPALHRNGAQRLDHVVAFTPLLDRTIAALEAAGFNLRRVRDAVLPGGGTRQAFFGLGEVILEVIEQPTRDGSPSDPSLPARLWGLAFVTADVDVTAACMGDRLGKPRDAVQPGRRIATVRREAGLGVPVAFITPSPR